MVHFNAWKHQHVDPPWWAFYDAILKGIHGSILSEPLFRSKWSRLLGAPDPAHRFRGPTAARAAQLILWGREAVWRFWNPNLYKALGLTLLTVFFLLAMFMFGAVKIVDGSLQIEGSTPSFVSLTALTILGGGSAIWSFWSTLWNSLLPGTPDAAKNYSLGAGDPLARFSIHFASMMRAVNRPVLVVVDDLDRCDARFVTELVRGMQTIMRSSRVMYLLLGDRDWIEQCFAQTHDSMKNIQVGDEHEFGARFVEKAIQFAFVLPEIDSDDKARYLEKLLAREGGSNSQDLAPQRSQLLNVLPKQLSAAGSVAEMEKIVADAEKAMASEISAAPELDAGLRELRRVASVNIGADRETQSAIAHRLQAIEAVLPGNPRQIKRILNSIALAQEVARIELGYRPGDADWQALVLWVVLMTEWPKTWFTLSRYPDLADMVLSVERASDAAQVTTAPLLPPKYEEIVARIRSRPQIMSILDFQGRGEWLPVKIDSARIAKLRTVLPATSGKMLQPD